MSGRSWRGKRVSEMTDAEIRDMAGAAPGVVRVRLSGEARDIEALAGLLAAAEGNAVAGRVAILTPGGDVAEFSAVEILDRSQPRANRRDPGERIYLTVRVSRDGGQR